MSDLSFVNAPESTFEYTINDERKIINIKPLRLLQLAGFLSEISDCGEFFGNVYAMSKTHGVDGAISAITDNNRSFKENLPKIMKAISIASGIDIEDINNMDIDQVVMLILVVFEKNQSIFKKKIPDMKAVMDRIKTNGL